METKLSVNLITEKKSAEVPLGKFIVPIPDTPIGIEFYFFLKISADGSISIDLKENGYVNIGVKNDQHIGNFSAASEVTTKATMSGQVHFSQTMYPAIFQIKQTFIGIESSLIGIKAEITSDIYCHSETVKFNSNSKVKLDVVKKINYEFELYEFEIPLIDNKTCDTEDKSDNEKTKKVGDFEITLHSAKGTRKVNLDRSFYLPDLYRNSKEYHDLILESSEIGSPERIFVVLDLTISYTGEQPQFINWGYLIQPDGEKTEFGYSSNASSWGYTLEKNFYNDVIAYFYPGDTKRGYFYVPYVTYYPNEIYKARIYDKEGLGFEPDESVPYVEWEFTIKDIE